MEQREVVIAGGGPAGAACAKALVEEGIDVVVLEKDALPRPKICSGILFGQTQILLEKYFGLQPPDAVCCDPEWIHAENIREWSSKNGFAEYVWELPKDGRPFPTRFRNIWRSRFDHWLLEQSGSEFRENCIVNKVEQHDEGVAVGVLQKDKIRVESREKDKAEQTLLCSYLIGADGGNSFVRRLLDPSWTASALNIVVYQTYNRFSSLGRIEDGHWNVFFEPDIGDILCCIHRKDDFATLCVGGFKERNLKESMERFRVFLHDNFSVDLQEEERVEGCVLRAGPPDLGSERILLTGEAAGIIYLNGEGISAAIDSGYRAGKAVAEALKHGGDAAELYRRDTADILEHIQLCGRNMHFMTVQS